MKKKILIWILCFCGMLSVRIQAEELEIETEEWLMEEYPEDIFLEEETEFPNEEVPETDPEEDLILDIVEVTPVLPEKKEPLGSGACGEQLDWILDRDGVLRIRGTGKMYDYSFGGAPFLAFRDEISEIRIDNGVTSIGTYAFANLEIRSDLVLPESVISIGDHAFQGMKFENFMMNGQVRHIGAFAFAMSSLKTMVWPETIRQIEPGTFYDCAELTEMILPSALSVIGTKAFYGCMKWKELCIPENVRSIHHLAFADTGLERVRFLGSAGTFAPDIFEGIEAAVYYQEGDDSWTEEVCVSCGGDLQWMARSVTVEEFISRTYRIVLGLDISEEELFFWYDALKTGQFTAASYLNIVFTAPEYHEKAGKDEDYVKMIYQAVLDHPVDSAALQEYTEMLETGFSRRLILTYLVNGEEFGTFCLNNQLAQGTMTSPEYRDRNLAVTRFVSRCYEEAWGRKWDVSGFETWCEALIKGYTDPKKCVRKFIMSKNVTARNLTEEEFIILCYRICFGREADEEGLDYWIKELSDGRYTRKQICNKFLKTEEFEEIIESFAI